MGIARGLLTVRLIVSGAPTFAVEGAFIFIVRAPFFTLRRTIDNFVKKHNISKLRENTFLEESKDILDSKTDLLVDEITSAFNSYGNSNKKIG